jgi:hypothetical protein
MRAAFSEVPADADGDAAAADDESIDAVDFFFVAIVSERP